ncbi:hypothetical protein F5Y16DRAFT_386610 [Xylariaceae sp. FL0255]|nr:hypothetical protein F5Y16DRAFT_386610 [Xylariaceae sp. FL0255]
MQAGNNIFTSRISEDDVADESAALVEDSGDSTRVLLRHASSKRHNLWIWTTFVLAFILLSIEIRDLIQIKRDVSLEYDYEGGFDTDWSPTRDVIRTKRVKFYGGIFFHENRTRYVTTNPDEPVYVGPPSQEIDDAWEELTYHESIAVTREEAKEVSDRSEFDKYRGHYTVGLSVIHSLHCLNAFRMSQDKEYYRAKGEPEIWWSRLHIDHCINQLRQAIQCHSDLTPFPLVPAVQNASLKGWITPDFDVEHTCRDFSAIRKWSTEKHNSGIQKAKAATSKGSP